jgi:3',5'-cyclic AMP phosphodiesterase CpdA
MLIAQISDPHIFGAGQLMEGRIDTADHLARALSTLKNLQTPPELLLLTGDLVNDGLAEQYEHLQSVLADDLSRMIVVAGNHDDREGLRHYFPQLRGVGSEGDELNYVVDHECDGFDVSIVVLDTTVPGEHGGALNSEQLTWLAQQLESRRDRRVIVAQHHPPFRSGIGFMDNYGLRGAEDEADVIGRFTNVDAVLCGHLHRPASSAFGGTVAFASPSTAAQVSPAFGGETTSYTEESGMFSLHYWTSSGLVTHLHPIDGPGKWVPAWAQ